MPGIADRAGKGITMAKKSIILLSDLHVGRGRKVNRRAAALVREIPRSFSGVPVLITGDLTDSATKKQFKDTRELLNRLAKTNPVLMVPGNHDYAWHGIILRKGSWKEWLKYLGTPLGWGTPDTPWMEPSHEPVGVDGVGVWKDGPIVYFGVDSGDPDDHEHTSRGWISPQLAQGLKTSLQKYAGKTRIVLVHHHPFKHAQFTKMKGAQRFMAAVKGNCELLLFGHKHEYGLWWNRDSIPLAVASHKSTNLLLSGDCLAVTVIDIDKPGTENVSFSHRLAVLIR
jgi:3',5'-cyclic AMP phosphodiesterase CpdA